MIDINLIRESYEFVKANYEKRKDEDLLKRLALVKEYDDEWRQAQYNMQQKVHEKNELSKSINAAKKAGKVITPIVEHVQKIQGEVAAAQELSDGLKAKRDTALKQLPNLLHESVPYGADDTENTVVRTWGKITKQDFDVQPNPVIGEALGIADFDSASTVAGSGFYYLKGDLVRLHQALLQFSLDFMIKKGFTPVEPPLFLRREVYEGVTDLADFEDILYKVEGEDAYLISTSEHPLVGLHKDDVLEHPVKYVGISPCFRSEIGSHGIEEKGLFRTHQFWKVEQVAFCHPDKSWELHEELLKNAEEIMQALELPYRIVNICTGDIGIVAAKKYDIEVWMPSVGEYKEIHSCSNCTDYQSRRLHIRIGERGGETVLAHTLNSTAVPGSRAMVAILENYQKADGTVSVPKVLQPYMGGLTVIGKV